MRKTNTKVDGVDVMPAANYNAQRDELENTVESADITLNNDAGPDTNLNMLSQAIAAYANAGAVYQDSGVADAYVLSIASNLKEVTKYYDNMMIAFKAGNTCTGASTVNVNALGVKSITLPSGSALTAGNITADAYVIAVYNLSSDRFELTVKNNANSGNTIQSVNNQSGAMQTNATATIIPSDNTIPQNTEGDEYFTLAITPTDVLNILVIEAIVHANVFTSTNRDIVLALFQDSTVDALAVGMHQSNESEEVAPLIIRYQMVAGTTSLTTFKLRGGSEATTPFTVNGRNGVGLYGGVLISEITIKEIKV